jgi:hypothetical protein
MIDLRSGAWRARLKCAFLAAALVIVAHPPDGEAASRGNRAAPFVRPGSGLPTPFRISPDRDGWFRFVKVIYQPLLNRYVCFFYQETAAADIVWSRLINSRGQATSGLQKIWEARKGEIDGFDVAYNDRDNRFFIVGADGAHDGVHGILVDGSGRPIPSLDPVVIKPETGDKTGFYPRVAWIPTRNQYAVGWSSRHPSHPEEASRNGQHFAVVGSALQIVKAPRKIKSQTMKDRLCYLSSFLVVENLLLWGTAEESPAGDLFRPVVWFTDFDGRVKTSLNPATKGLLYPGGYGRGEGFPDAAFNPADRALLLHWNTGNEKDLFSGAGRIVSSLGRFLSPALRFPKAAPEAWDARAVFGSADRRFFRVNAEFTEVWGENRIFYGGRLYGLLIGPDGTFVDKSGKAVSKATRLTAPVNDPDLAFFLGGVGYNSRDNSYLAAFMIQDLGVEPTNLEIWGVIYK